MLSISNISKSYGAIKALDDISFEVASGEIFGLIGPDGAGKTSMFRILATLLLPDQGAAKIAGLDVVRDYKALRHRIGYMPGRFSLYQDLSVAENLEFFAAVFGTSIEANYQLIAPIYDQLKPFKDRRAGALSGGMKQKLALCCALIHKPDLLLLDEPGTGVDPVSRKEFWDMLRDLRDGGLTILVSTPYMDEAALCDRVALLQNGRIMAMDTPEKITAAFSRPIFAARSADMYRLIQDLRAMPGVADCYAFGEFAHAVLDDRSLKSSDLLQYLQECGHTEVQVKNAEANIEDCFIELMKKETTHG
ncbi:MAG: ABC transporter ATP-binding protein [Chitinophagales bacterium]|nr:ABC transporter ATP-binding protein [Chitinophagales bacterium]